MLEETYYVFTAPTHEYDIKHYNRKPMSYVGIDYNSGGYWWLSSNLADARFFSTEENALKWKDSWSTGTLHSQNWVLMEVKVAPLLTFK